MKVQYKLEAFEGPLDLLLHLIEQSEVDIYNISISEITEQYLAYVGAMQVLELEVASEFLLMAATLLSIKSRMLLPKPPVIETELIYEEDEEDPREQLIRKLIEYRKYKGIADQLREKELERSLIYSREPVDLSPYARAAEALPVQGLFMADLVFALQKTLRKAAKRNIVNKIRRDEISVKDRMKEIMETLMSRGGKLLFSKLFAFEMTREEIVVTFVGLLELIKMKQVHCYQHRLFEDIVIQANSSSAGGWPDGLPTDEINY